MTAILAAATILLQLAPQLFKTIEGALPFAEKFLSIIQGNHVDAAALDALLAEINANSAEIQKPIDE